MSANLNSLIALTYNECDQNGETVLAQVVAQLQAMPPSSAIAEIISVANNDNCECTLCVLATVRKMLKDL